MFSKLDTSADLFLDQTELAAINLDKYEVCIRPFFNSCDTYKDGRVSTAEWCFCFWRESEHWGPRSEEAAPLSPGCSPAPCRASLSEPGELACDALSRQAPGGSEFCRS